MKKLLNTLYVTQNGAYVHKNRETVAVRLEQKQVLQVPMLALTNIFCFGRVTISPQLMEHCVNYGVGIAFFSEYGRFYARVQGRKNGNVLLRRQQYRIADDEEKCCNIVRYIVGAKISNSRIVLLKSQRNRPETVGNDQLRAASDMMKLTLNRTRKANCLDQLRGYEGEGANVYFGAFDHLISQQKDSFKFTSRNRRPPKDPVNAILSFLYSVLLQDCVSALEGVGLDSYVGFLHRDRPGRQSLALDLLEEFRAFIGDRLCLSLINLKQITKADFEIKENGGVFLKTTSRKILLQQYQKRKQDTIHHPILNETIKIGLLFHTQALLLARHLRGDIDYYPAFIGR